MEDQATELFNAFLEERRPRAIRKPEGNIYVIIAELIIHLCIYCSDRKREGRPARGERYYNRVCIVFNITFL